MIPRALNAIGLMRVMEHERAMSDRVSIAVHNDVVNAFKEQLANKEAKFQRAATNLAAQAEEITHLKVRLHYAEPRAQKWDDYLKRSRDRKEASNHRTTKKKGE